MKVKTQSAKLKAGCAVRQSHKGKSEGKLQMAKSKSEKPYIHKSLPKKTRNYDLAMQSWSSTLRLEPGFLDTESEGGSFGTNFSLRWDGLAGLPGSKATPRFPSARALDPERGVVRCRGAQRGAAGQGDSRGGGRFLGWSHAPFARFLEGVPGSGAWPVPPR